MTRLQLFSKLIVLAGLMLMVRSAAATPIIPSPSNDILLASNGGVADINGSSADGPANYPGLPPANLNDGDRDGYYNSGGGVDGAGSIAHTSGPGVDQYMEVTLPAATTIDSIILFNRTDCCGDRISPFEIQVLNGATVVYDNNGVGNAGLTFVPDIPLTAGNGNTAAGMTFNFPTVLGDVVKVIQHNNNYMNLAELEAYKPVPEPSSLILLGLGAVGIFAIARRRKAA